MDVKTAFLYGDINTKIYIEQPKGIGAIRELYKVYKLNKALYSLKQLPRVQYFTLTAYLKTLSFKPLIADNYIFYNSKGIYITVFVNNLLIVGLFKANISIIKAKLSKRFYIIDLAHKALLHASISPRVEILLGNCFLLMAKCRGDGREPPQHVTATCLT